MFINVREQQQMHLYTNVSRCVVLRMREVSDKSRSENRNSYYVQ